MTRVARVAYQFSKALDSDFMDMASVRRWINGLSQVDSKVTAIPWPESIVRAETRAQLHICSDAHRRRATSLMTFKTNDCGPELRSHKHDQFVRLAMWRKFTSDRCKCLSAGGMSQDDRSSRTRASKTFPYMSCNLYEGKI